MALSLDDIEQEVEEQKPAAKAKPAASSAPANSVAPPAAEDTSFSGMLNKARQQGPAVINEAWKGVAPYLNPIHYQEGGPQDYTNIDWPTTVAHGVGEAALGYGLAKRGSRMISGEAGAERAAQKEYREQNKLAREKFEYQKKMDAEAKRAAQPPLRAAPTPVTPPPPTPVQVAQQTGPVVARPADVAAVSNPDASGNTLAIEERRIARQNQATQDLYRAAQPNFQSPKLTTPPVSVAGAPAAQPPVAGGQPLGANRMSVPPQQGDFVGPKLDDFMGPKLNDFVGPQKPPPTVAEMGQQSGGVISEAAKAPAEAIPPEPQKQGKKRGTSTKEERTAKQESYNKLAAESPEGFHPQYTKKKGEMGPGAYNWLYGQEGEKAPQVWKALFGDKNIPYSHEPSSELQSRYADYKLSVPEPGMGLNEPPRVEGGAHKKPKYIPKNIKGAISPGAALGSGAIAAALGLSASPEAQAAMQRASSAVQDLGVSPDIFAGKGEELGRLGSTYVTAGNPSYRAELLTEMKKTKDPERYQLLLKEYEKAKGNVPGGRGIAPPSAYMR